MKIVHQANGVQLPVAFKPVGVDSPTFRWREIDGGVLYTNDAGRFFLADEMMHDRFQSKELTPTDRELLERSGLLPRGELGELALRFAGAQRNFEPGPLDYLILVPTLRCNLACSYCQVSRAAIGAKGFDWSEETHSAVLDIISGVEASSIKIEFQGGEPTLRPDLINSVINAIPEGVDATFVVCTNLQLIDDQIIAIFDRPDVFISTSLDGPLELHSRQRQFSDAKTERFFSNLTFLLDRYGPAKISALPTVDPKSPPDADELIDAFAIRGFESIYLRPINYQGFARKRHAHAKQTERVWKDYHEHFIERLIERNFENRESVVEETYFSLLLRRIFRPGSDRHVDLRNPNPVGQDYIVVDHDGTVYPTDEARMLARSGIIDLSIGDVASGWDTPARAALDAASTLEGDPTCAKCAYKPFCGRDIVDDIARYGTVDLPREKTEFCRRHLHLFDFAMKMLHDDDEKVRYSINRWLGISGRGIVLGDLR